MKLELELQRRSPKTGKPRVTKKKYDPRKLGVVVIDLWNWHWCKTASERAAAMVPRMNRALECLRPLGVQVLLCPTDVADSYVGTPQRERAVATPRRPMPTPKKTGWPSPRGGDCMCGPGIKCEGEFGWNGMCPAFVIEENDLVVRGNEELYSICKERGITDLIYFGLHTNMCVMGKPCGIAPMVELGLDVVLARDVTDAQTEYDPDKPYTPDDGTTEVVQFLETHCFPTVHIKHECEKLGLWNDAWITEPIRFAPWGAKMRPHHFEKPFALTMTIPWLDDAEVRYTTDGSEPTPKSKLYTKPITVRDTTTLKAAAFKDGKRVSFVNETYYTKLGRKPPMPDLHLSDLKPFRIRWPGADVNAPRMDRSYPRTPLKMRGVEYKKGIGAIAPSQLAYELKPEYDRFVALAGIDETILLEVLGANFSAFPTIVYRVFIDGEFVTESPVMRITEEPWRFDVKIPRGSRLLTFNICDAGNGNFLDYANVVNAGFVLKKSTKGKQK